MFGTGIVLDPLHINHAGFWGLSYKGQERAGKVGEPEEHEEDPADRH